MKKSCFLEAKTNDKAGASSFLIRVIKAGLSGNKNYYSDALLKEAVSMFDNIRVFEKSDAEHLKSAGKDVRNLIGRLTNPKFIEGTAKDAGEIQATFELLQPNGDVAIKLREAFERNMTDLFGFSIDADALARTKSLNGQRIREAAKFKKINSVDLIVEPGAGGGIVNFIEAQNEEEQDIMKKADIIKLLEAKSPNVLKGKDIEALTDEEVNTLLTEALSSEKEPENKSNETEQKTENFQEALSDAVNDAVKMIEAKASMKELIADSTLPKEAKEKLRKQFSSMEKFTEAQVEQAIKDEREYLSKFTEAGKISGLGDTAVTKDQFEKTSDRLDAFFDVEHKEHRHALSFKEAYIDITGDKKVTGRFSDCSQARLTEALNSSSFDDALGNAITRRLIADYRQASQYDIWKKLIGSPVPVNDFRSQERVRIGGYGDVPAVTEGADYSALTSPSDEKSTYAVSKRGGLETITLEMIKNDDVGAIRQIPTKLSRAAKRTLCKFALDFIKDNPAIYDGVNLFHADHGNLGSEALTKTALAAGRLAMLKQAEAGSNEPLGIGPKCIFVSPDNEETAVDLFRRNTENDKNFVQSLSLEVVPVFYWTDVNDWVLTADPLDLPFMELGFLDGQEEPEIFVQDNPTSGSMFSADKITYKLRHIYGGSILDYRGLFKSVVANS
ncbi:MAG: hypothetical protein AB7U85_04900 [Alphaproteobacteria bacterium]